tara:strand:- start:45 stop:383 length:339 start_codon:yes stop_codon:yes gene_type:complete
MNSREKGKRKERAACKLWLGHGYIARRTAQNRGSGDSPDIEVEGLPDLHIEVKGGERINHYQALLQAERDSDQWTTPVVQCVPNRKPCYMVMWFQDFVELVKDAEDWRNRKR